ncbi:MAG: chromate efflux transporter [Alphaproteobacteria bacterium]|nr:chromate efflux transporter [Alphaproteobacteria bacterium]
MTQTPPRSKSDNIGKKTPPPLVQSTAIWGKIGLLSFGGPTAQIALMHQLIVAERRWLNEAQFLNALSFCMLLPGPEAMQLATYAGWRIHGVLGGIVAGLLFVLPGALIMLCFGIAYVYFGTFGIVGALFLGVKASIVVIVLQALIRLAGKALQKPHQWVIAIISFCGIFILALPFPLIIAMVATYGFASNRQAQATTTLPPLPKGKETAKAILIWAGIWWGPLLAIDLFADAPLLAEIGYFFSKLAVVTFGGAYAVLAYMAQDVVGQLGWLQPAEMMDGLGLAETTPGPLILVTEFVGFLAAFKTAGIAHGIAGAGIALWATFIPCFLWIFAGAPYLDWLTYQPRLQGALASIMAAVVGVIANLFAWFALHLFFAETSMTDLGIIHILTPNLASLDLRVIAITLVCAFLAFGRGIGLFWLLGLAALAGAMMHLIPLG